MECIPTLSIGKKSNFQALKEMLQNGDSFDTLFSEIGFTDHASLVIDSLDILSKLISLSDLHRLKFIPHLMPIYLFQNSKLVSEKTQSKYTKFFDVHIRLESSE